MSEAAVISNDANHGGDATPDDEGASLFIRRPPSVGLEMFCGDDMEVVELSPPETLKAIILVGGFGSRLRPLTLSRPKSMVEFCNIPIIVEQMFRLSAVGVTDIVLAISFNPSMLRAALAPHAKKYSITLHYSRGEESLGTAGTLALAKPLLQERGYATSSKPFFVVSSDVMWFSDLSAQVQFHRNHKCIGTVLVTHVDDPSLHGVVLCDRHGVVHDFVEKPKRYLGSMVSAGIYIFDPDIFDRIKPLEGSLEKEIFPALVQEMQLRCARLKGPWINVSQPLDFLKGTSVCLKHIREVSGGKQQRTGMQLAKSTTAFKVIGNVLIHPTAKVGQHCVLGPDVVIGANCSVGDGVRIANTTLLSEVRVHDRSCIHDAIIGWQSTVGHWCRIDDTTILGEDVTVKDELYITGGIVLPHKVVSKSIEIPGTIIL